MIIVMMVTYFLNSGKEMNERTEPLFLNLFRSTGIDSQPGGPVQQHVNWYRPVMNRFLDSLNVYSSAII
jgi:hypothetical protein